MRPFQIENKSLKEEIYIKDPSMVRQKIFQMNFQKLQIYSTFEGTIINGEYEHLFQLDIFKNISDEINQLIVKMKNNQTTVQQLISSLQKHKIANDTILNNIKQQSIKSNFQSFLQIISYLNIPFVILSQNFDHIVVTILQNSVSSFQDCRNLQLITNCFYMDFQNNMIIDMEIENLINFSKQQRSTYQQHVIYLGNESDNHQIIKQIQGDNILSIGFLYSNSTQSINTMMDNYDIVLSKDSGFTIPQIILKTLLNEPELDFIKDNVFHLSFEQLLNKKIDI